MKVYVVLIHLYGNKRTIFHGVYSTREKAEQVCAQLNAGDELFLNEWADFISTVIDEDVMEMNRF